MLRILFFILIFTSCTVKEKIDGVWFFELQQQDKKISFYVQIQDQFFIIQNNLELIKLEFTQKDNRLSVPILGYDAAIELEQQSMMLKGHWIKFNRTPEYKLSLFGMKTRHNKLPKIEDHKIFDNNTRFKMTFSDEKPAILNFTNTHASILTQSGDYRFLSPKLIGEKLILSGFDGMFSFYVEGELKDKKSYTATLYAGPYYKIDFKAILDNAFELADPAQITKLKGKIENIKLTNLEGEELDLISLNKATVLQIFGSWCPNCIDETKFINEWRSKQSIDRLSKIDFKLVSFERSPNKEEALKLLRKSKKLYQIDYPILLGGYTPEDKVEKIFPTLHNFISFPTTIYINAKGEVIKIHAGFNGPATGDFYEQFKIDFEDIMNKLTNNSTH
jgi:thiol-disulfide isomerase/thioredoxin